MKKFFTFMAITLMTMCLAVPAMAIDDMNNAPDGAQAGAEVGNVQSILTFMPVSQYEAANLNDGRGFVVPADIAFPGLAGYYAEPTKGPRFMQMKHLLMYTTEWDVEKCRAALDKSGDVELQIRDLVVNGGAAPSKKVYVSAFKPAKAEESLKDMPVTQKASGVAATDDKDTISLDLMLSIIVAAGDRGANYVHLFADGVYQELDSGGAGIGINVSHATMGSDNKSSTVGSGGTGVSWAWAGYEHYPWMQYHILDVDGLVLE
jgi:hypothetical protein